jgi:hypothetical protein
MGTSPSVRGGVKAIGPVGLSSISILALLPCQPDLGNSELVGVPGFEPGISYAQGKRDTRLRYTPTLFICTDLHGAKPANQTNKDTYKITLLRPRQVRY